MLGLRARLFTRLQLRDSLRPVSLLLLDPFESFDILRLVLGHLCQSLQIDREAGRGRCECSCTAVPVTLFPSDPLILSFSWSMSSC